MKKMKEFWDEKFAGHANVFTRSYRSKRLNKLYSTEIEKECLKTPRKLFSLLRAGNDKEERKIEQTLAIEKS